MSNFLTRRPRQRQRGFTLVELMVAITIALFLVLGLSALYVNMKTAFNSQDKLGQLQDTERVAATMLSKTIQSAAYFPKPMINPIELALPLTTTANPDGTTFGAAQGIIGTSVAGGSDTVDVRYQVVSGDGLMNCLGDTFTSGTSGVTTQTWVSSFAVNANHELTCSVNGGTPVALVGGVNQMTVLYGVDTNGDGFTDTYLNAVAITSAALWANVRTAQITLNFLNPLVAQTGAGTTLPTAWVQTINLMNKS